MNEYTVSVPTNEMAFFRQFVKKMGWKARKKRKSGLELAIEDVEKGELFEAKDVDDLLKQLSR